MVDIWECALGFMDSQVLLTAEEIGVFDVLEERPRSSADVASAVGLPHESAERLLAALCALELVEKLPDGTFTNTEPASAKLVRGKPGYIGSMFQHVRESLYPLWGHFGMALVEGGAQWELAFPDRVAPNVSIYDDPAALRSFMDGMHAISYKASAEFAPRATAFRGVERVVDVGGASGAFLIALAEQHEHLHGAVFDLPPVQPIAEDYFERSGLQHRLAFYGGNFWEDPLPAGADAYALGFILHDWDEQGGSKILEKIADSSRRGGLLVIGEYLLRDDKTGPLNVVRQDLNMLVSARGRERSAPEYADWIARFGFDLEAIELTSSGKSFLVARRT